MDKQNERDFESPGGALLKQALSRPLPSLAPIREAFPELNDFSDDMLRKKYAPLVEAAEVAKRCRGCKSFAGCWRDEINAGQVLKVVIEGERFSVVSTTCFPFQDHSRQKAAEGVIITELDPSWTFESFPHNQAEEHDELFAFMRNFAEEYEGGGGTGAFIFGPTGIGKTHLLQALAIRLVNRGIAVGYTRTDDMVNAIRDASSKDAIGEFVKKLVEVPVLCIDEFGQEYATDFTVRKTLEILDARNRKKRPTFFTSNYKPPDVYDHLFERIGNAIVALRSRLYEMALAAPMTGDDHRTHNIRNALRPRSARDGE